MKKTIALFVMVLFAGGIQNVHAQAAFKNADAAATKAENMITSFKESSDAEVLSIGPLLIGMAKPFVSEPEAKAVLKIAKGLVVADLEDCSADVKKRFTSQMGNFIDSLGDFKVMEVRDGEDNVIVIGDEKKITCMLVCGSDCEVVLIKLSATPEEFGELMQIANN